MKYYQKQLIVGYSYAVILVIVKSSNDNREFNTCLGFVSFVKKNISDKNLVFKRLPKKVFFFKNFFSE
jgi:hypothetical protein